ncbi:MAG TPA: PA14 domain-containing protein [Sedimentisphaerales bacterium]|nr:PA14 domain-containing protein [Sedimentisphaerales bacterium]
MQTDLVPGATYYWRVDHIDGEGKVYVGDVWSFVATPNTAYSPSPRDGDKWIDIDTALTWLPGRTATTHEVYLGLDRQAVTNRDASTFEGSLNTQIVHPDRLQAGVTYYWAVDELDEDHRYEGLVWSFTTFGGGGVRAEYFPNMTVSGLPAVKDIEDQIRHFWGTGPIVGLLADAVSGRWTADLEIALADTYTFITTSDDGVRLWLDGELLIDNWTDHGPMDDYSRPISLSPGVYSLRLEWYDLWQGATLQLSWQTAAMGRQVLPAGPLQPPLRACLLHPANGDVNVPREIVLRWLPGERAMTHDIYFGPDAQTVAAATPADTEVYQGSLSREETTWTPGSLEWSRTYYWRIDEINPDEPDSLWRGKVYCFTTAAEGASPGSAATPAIRPRR